MPNPIKLKRSDVLAASPAVGSLQLGEVTVNTADKVLHFMRQTAGVAGLIEELSGRGGLLFDATLPYKIGDLVSEGGIGYLKTNTTITTPGGFNLADWTKITDSERGGLEYDILKTYVAGDIVSNSGVAYIKTGTSVTSPGAWTLADWTEVSPQEQGGVQYRDSISYASGDIVGFNNKFYICTAPTAGTPTTPVTFDPTNWKAQSDIVFNPALAYTAGEMVYDSGDIWYASVDMAIGELPGADADWINATLNEVAGKEYSSAALYDLGDMVMNTGVAYYCTTSPVNVGAWLLTDWTRITVDEVGGKVWDVVQSTAGAYVLGDMVIHGAVGSEVAYFLTTTPETTPGVFTLSDWTRVTIDERGGIAYLSGADYVVGDIVTDTSVLGLNEAYVCIIDDATSATDPNTNVNWKRVGNDPEVGGKEYDDTRAYVVGDIVSNGDESYRCITDIASPGHAFVAAEWDSVERGGRAYDTTRSYAIGDIISEAGISYRCIQATAGTQGTPVPFVEALFWESLELPEKAGAVYDPTWQYEIGDVVSIGDELYIIGEDPLNLGDPMAVGADPTDPLQNTTSDPFSTDDEVGGKIFNATVAIYSVGDVVTYDDGTLGEKLYRCILVPGTNPGAFVATDWELAEIAEVGGRIFSIDEDYLKGDIVTYHDSDPLVKSSRVYVALVDSAKPAGAWVPLEWEMTDIGGVEYRTTVTYNEGDLVSDITVTPVKVYVSLQDVNKGNPLSTTPAYWQELDSEFYTATGVNSGDADGDGAVDNPNQHCPTSSLGEYPDCTAGDSAGATWYISGLGFDVNGDPTPYTMGTGSLIGSAVREGDAIYWMSGAAGAAHGGTENWRLAQRPLVAGERGGLIWRSGGSYATGDTVTEGTELYLGLAPVSGSAPSLGVAAEWKLLDTDENVAGRAFDAGNTYQTGDIVTVGGIIYYNTTGTTGTTPPGNTTDWALAEAKPEVGGLGYDGTTASYDLGTVVGFGTIAANQPGGGTEAAGEILYVANTAGAVPGTLADWTLLETSPEVGGVEYDPAIVYTPGDVVHYNDVLYVVPTPAPAFGSLPDTWGGTEIGSERGGIAWLTATDYLIGDVVVDSGIAYLCNNGHLASALFSTDIANWTRIGTPEIGGIAYKTAFTPGYTQGDVVVNGGIAYLCNTTYDPSVDFTTDTAKFTEIGIPEKGGIPYGAGVEYIVGDLVTDNATGLVYYCIVDIPLPTGLATAPSSDTTNWKVSSAPEEGGVLWKSVIEYPIGHIVTDDLTGDVYRAIAITNVGLQPSTPANAGFWTIVNPSERGGILHDMSVDYVAGDFVSIGGAGFIALINNGPAPANAVIPNPPTTDAIWKPLAAADEVGGLLYSAAKLYAVGAVVNFDNGTTGMNLYSCITAIAIVEAFDAAKWDLVTDGGSY